MNDNSHEGKLARIEGRLDRPVANAIAVRSGSMKIIQLSAGAGGFYALGSDGSLWSYWWDVNLAGFKWTEIPLPCRPCNTEISR
jgi:hypothetical protein